MAKKEKPVADNETGKIKVKAKKEQQPTNNETKGNVTKVKSKMKKPAEDLSEAYVTKINLNKQAEPENNEVKEEVTKDNIDNSGADTKLENAEPVQEQKEVQQEAEAQETPVVEEITNEVIEENTEQIVEQAKEAIVESTQTGQPLPENIQKLVDFMEETGGDVKDYVALNQNYNELDDHTLLREYYNCLLYTSPSPRDS